MSNGTLYVKDFPRAILARSLVKYYKIDVKVEDAETSETYKRDCPVGRIPAFVGPNDFILTEIAAINPFLVELISDEKVKKQLLGKDYKERALIAKWISLSNTDFFMTLADIFYMYINRYPYHQDIVDRGFEQLEKVSETYENRLKDHKYLVNDDITLADLLSVTQWAFAVQLCYGPEWRAKYPGIVRWVEAVVASPVLKDEYKDFKLCEKTFSPQKK
ncbi:hypothetical protein TPHA_0C00120 [Tetrapisispora phaffii CBS 4417]|uniref:GST C-terminal domain-containing protein n=1 Tax=Tetrapisispora phaffii (strain ATCC 24235 / CBS 4417 / NBRC 1672 / NRRL Y-8282 / UCD 70-5) TaxID=1071381 RepID=G8BQZ3_TETPH|nr:hypothetical protein TPHA_0C00120 [Tetrapisispora phaffii CBS 4417]CCE62169.1 hypothetical protein TPHA_0C00120 [Tetrapisispora phaffii CBS 4417]